VRLFDSRRDIAIIGNASDRTPKSRSSPASGCLPDPFPPPYESFPDQVPETDAETPTSPEEGNDADTRDKRPC
jgi:hypothetical protein